jgi:hypothetical protein
MECAKSVVTKITQTVATTLDVEVTTTKERFAYFDVYSPNQKRVERAARVFGEACNRTRGSHGMSPDVKPKDVKKAVSRRVIQNVKEIVEAGT